MQGTVHAGKLFGSGWMARVEFRASSQHVAHAVSMSDHGMVYIILHKNLFMYTHACILFIQMHI